MANNQTPQTRTLPLLYHLQKKCSSASHAASQTLLHFHTSLMFGLTPHTKEKDSGDG